MTQEIIWGLIGALWAASSLQPSPLLSPRVTGMKISLALVFVLDKMAFYTSANTQHIAGRSQASKLPNAGVASMEPPQSTILFGPQTWPQSSVNLNANSVWWL